MLVSDDVLMSAISAFTSIDQPMAGMQTPIQVMQRNIPQTDVLPIANNARRHVITTPRFRATYRKLDNVSFASLLRFAE